LAAAVAAQPSVVAAEGVPVQPIQTDAQLRAQAREAINAQRQAIQTRLQQDEKACWQRFAVEDCLRKVRSAAREQDTLLREQELGLNAQERKEKAAERLREIERKQAEKRVPAPVQITPRGANASVPAPAQGTTFPEGKSATEIAREQAERDSEARARAIELSERQQKQNAKVAEHEREEAQRRAQAQQDMQRKQQEAQAHRESKAKEIAARKGAPLPIPEGLPKP